MVLLAAITRAVALFGVCWLVINLEVRAQEQTKENKAGCGNRNKRGAGNQVSGARDGESQFGEFPWMLALFKQHLGEEKKYKCGASLIHPQVALTAAHCVVDNSTDTKFTIRAGAWDMDLVVEILPYQDREVKDIIIHPKYIPQALYNDIAVLILKTPLGLAEHISTVCLPPQNYEVDSGRGFSMGWGRSKLNDNSTIENTVILKNIDIPVVSKEVCEEKLRKTRLGPTFRLHDSFLCAGGEPGKDTCKGDGGSPLVFPVGEDPDKYFQAGIVAWGIGCWESNPAVYVNVAKFRNWIDEQMKNHSFNTSTYQYQPKNE